MTTFKIGGCAAYYAEPDDADGMREALRFASEHHLPFMILGGGANTLIPDDGYDGLVICTSALSQLSADGDRIVAGSGVSVEQLSDYAAEHGLSGLEFAAGLPGSAGGAVYMNARCYGHEFSDIVDSVHVLHADNGDETDLSHSEIDYRYKHSCFMDRPDLIILNVTFRMTPGDTDDIRRMSEANREDRRAKGQYDYPSAGCIFKNNYDIGIPSGKLIENAGLKNYSIGGARVYDRHANFIINDGNATADDVRRLIDHIQNVLDSSGYHIEPEIRIVTNRGQYGKRKQ